MEYQRRTPMMAPTRGRGRPRKINRLLGDAYLPARQNSFGQYQRVWVVFTDEARIWWLRWLRPGFRHCFAILNDSDHWLAVEPLASCMEVTVLPSPADFNLPEWLRGQGHRVVEAALQRKMYHAAPFAILNCVEVVKRLLGIRAPWILTPYQLYRHLQQQFLAAQTQDNSNATSQPTSGKTNG
jgi:hypothetical protein